MKKSRGFCFFVCVVMLSLSANAFADEIGCPAQVAFIDKDTLSMAATKTLKEIYAAQGCPQTGFFGVPGRRGIQSFNHGQVAGEVFRLEQAEALYEREFVRSSKPLFILKSSLWKHPEISHEQRRPTGYILGVVWMESHMKGENGKAFHSAEEMFAAYNEGLISRFLAADASVAIKIKRKELAPAPMHDQTIHEVPLFHYLGKEFSPFMAKLSQSLSAKRFRPFFEGP